MELSINNKEALESLVQCFRHAYYTQLYVLFICVSTLISHEADAILFK